MDKCSLCECDLPKERVHLGYKECLEWSDTEKYASHVVYPHKTGGYIQPMSSEQANDMKRLDRRSVGGERKAKGIVADKSWDRWLENYYNPKPPKKKFIPGDNCKSTFLKHLKLLIEIFVKDTFK